MPRLPPGWSGLGIAELQYARHGFGGQIHVMRARSAFDEALKLDPASTEANLYRIYMLLSRGEKESARHGIASLLASAANDWNVHLVAGIALRGDGMYDEALDEFSRALKLNPANAAILYNHRARVYHYQNQIELAGDELEKGLALEPRHPLLRTSAGYQQMRIGNLDAAIRDSRARDRRRCLAAHRRAHAGDLLCAGRRRGRAAQRCSRTTHWRRRRPTAKWLTGWPLTSPSKATPARRCTGCAAPSISATKTIPGSRKTLPGTICARMRTSSGFWRI